VAQEFKLIGPTMEQPQYNLFERYKVEKEFLPVYDFVGLGTTIWSPLASGLLTGKYNNGIPENSRLALPEMSWLKDKVIAEDKIKKVKELSELAKELGISMASLSIGWCIKNPHVTTAILGATKKEQLLDNLKAVDAIQKLTPDILERIERIMYTNPLKTGK
jgi:aryl-alcohol dehydrogenase-like predicted oxidoreductase